jgi:hypothetical protein
MISKVTPEFVDQVLYVKTISLAMKGSVYLTPAIRELLHFRFMYRGELGVHRLEEVIRFTEKAQRLRDLGEKLALYAAMDGGMDAEPSEEALEAVLTAVYGDG